MLNKSSNKQINLFQNYLYNQSQPEREYPDPTSDFYKNSREIKKTLKSFWKNKSNPFYKEAHKLYLISTITLLIWFFMSTIGFSLIAANVNNSIFVGIGSVCVVLGYVNIFSFVIYQIKNKPSYYHVILKDTKIKTNYQTMLFFYFFGFTALIGKAIFDAIQSEMILLTEIPKQ